MTHMFDGYNDIIRLQKGDHLSDAIKQFVADTDVQGAWLNGLGAALEATLGYYDLETKEYHWQTFNEPMEVASLMGNLARNEQGEMMFHLHGVLAGKDLKAVAGHIKDLVAGATLELFVHRTYQPLHRKQDETVGLQLLDLPKD